MAGFSMRVAVDDLRLQTALGAAIDALGDKTDLMDILGRAMVISAVERIAVTNRAPDGTAWLPSQRALAEGGPTLRDSGNLLDSINHYPGPDSVVVGTNMVQAAVLQGGAATGSLGVTSGTDKRGRRFTTASPWGDIPARPYIGFSDEDYETIGELSEGWLSRTLGGLQ